MTTFKELWVAQKFLDALDAKWYTTPTPIQEQAIPHVLAWRDVFWCAQTGTWKTASFSLPTLQRLDETHDDSTSTKGKKTFIRWLIITPTRELAIQIAENIWEYGKKSNLRSTVIYGGVSQWPQVKKLRKWVEILIATPGRLLDLINQKHVNLHQVEVFILDEADRMLDMGFINDIKKIYNYVPKKAQNLFFSATMAPKIMELANTFLKDPVSVEIEPETVTVDTVKQSLYTLHKWDKPKLLLEMLKDKSIKNAVLFTKTKRGANKVEKLLKENRVSSAAIHGNKSQNARQRALTMMKNGEIRILVATDVAARGIDISRLSHVIIYDVPLEPEVYVHRIWRTGRAGLEGDAVMFCEPEEVKYYKQIVKLIGKEVPLDTDHAYHLDLSNYRPAPGAWKKSKGRPNNRGNNKPARGTSKRTKNSSHNGSWYKAKKGAKYGRNSDSQKEQKSDWQDRKTYNSRKSRDERKARDEKKASSGRAYKMSGKARAQRTNENRTQRKSSSQWNKSSWGGLKFGWKR